MVQKVSPVLVSRALGSFRNSDFDAFAAIGEVIDNSLEAKSKNIRINLKDKVDKGRRIPTIYEIDFADDGHGMDKGTLHHCLQLGYSSSYNDRKGIGRFGVGMTLGAISQCKRIEVYSKTKGGKWYFTYIDLDEIKDEDEPSIPEPKGKDIPKEYEELIGERGTLVIWKKMDRMENLKEEEVYHWIAQTYRKFIGNEIIENNKVVKNREVVKIFLNSRKIDSFDPLYVTKNNNPPQDEGGEKAKLYDEIQILYPISDIDPPSGKKSGESKIIVRMSLLPEEWRLKEGDGGSTENRSRYVHENEGISILRNNREVFYGIIPNFKLKEGFIDLDRFWGCEICFNAELDHSFSVKNVKVGARPLPELRNRLSKEIQPTVYTCRRAIRGFWQKNSAERYNSTKGAISDVEEAEDILESILTKTAIPQEKEEAIITTVLKNSAITKMDLVTALREKLEKLPLTFVTSSELRTDAFMDVSQEGGKTLITFNANHPYFNLTITIIERLKEIAKAQEDDESLTLVAKLDTSMKLLFGNLGRVQKDMDQDEIQQVSDTFDRLLLNWSLFLKQSMEKLDLKMHQKN
jgi:hypothetical protein